MTSNIEKEQIIMFSFINKKQIRKLMDGTHQQSVSVFEKVRDDVKKDGKILFHENKVPTGRVIKVLELNVNEIHKKAEIERQIKKDASTQSLATRSIQ